jgi:hypothetical protein
LVRRGVPGAQTVLRRERFDNGGLGEPAEMSSVALDEDATAFGRLADHMDG